MTLTEIINNFGQLDEELLFKTNQTNPLKSEQDMRDLRSAARSVAKILQVLGKVKKRGKID